MSFKAACIQTNCSDDLAANVSRVMPMVEQAAADGADFIALPENAFLMEDQGGKLFQKAIPPEAHPGVQACRAVAKQHACWILIGSIPVQDTKSEGKVFNTAILINNDGNMVREYQKIHLFDVELGGGESYRESNRYSAGTCSPIVQLPWCKLGLTICYDVRFPQLYRDLAQAGADVLAIPAAFTQVTGEAHWHVLQRARAIENGCFVIAPAQWGEHPGKRHTYGHSLIIDPWGTVLADGGEGEGVISAIIDTSLVHKTRLRVPSLANGRDYAVDC